MRGAQVAQPPARICHPSKRWEHGGVAIALQYADCLEENAAAAAAAAAGAAAGAAGGGGGGAAAADGGDGGDDDDNVNDGGGDDGEPSADAEHAAPGYPGMESSCAALSRVAGDNGARPQSKVALMVGGDSEQYSVWWPDKKVVHHHIRVSQCSRLF